MNRNQRLFPYLVSLISLVLVWVPGELLVRRLLPQPTWSQYSKRYLIDGKWDYEIPFARQLSGLPFALKPNFEAREVIDKLYPGSRMDIHLNSDGFRTHAITSSVKRGEVRILLAGDSVTFGTGAMERDTFPHQLEELASQASGYKKIIVYNLGVPGYGPAEYYQVINQYIDRIKPHLVIVNVFMGNDRADVQNDAITFDRRKRPVSVSRHWYWVSRDGHLRSNENPLYHIPIVRDSHFALFLYRYTFGMASYCVYYLFSRLHRDQKWETVLTAIQQLCTEHATPIIWAVLPSEGQLLSRQFAFEKYFSRVILNPKPFYVAPLLDRERVRYPHSSLYVDGSHFSKFGHEIYARLLFSEINRQYPALLLK